LPRDEAFVNVDYSPLNRREWREKRVKIIRKTVH
jgi:hypothetical protein